MNQSEWRKHQELEATKEEIQRYSLPQRRAYKLIFQY